MNENVLRFPLQFAKQYASRYLTDLLPFCSQAMVVGSVRRDKPSVHDIEFLLIPVMKDLKNMFGEVTAHTYILDHEMQDIAKKWDAKIVKAGMHYKKLFLAEGIPLDIFISDETRWGVETVIRTGPAEFSKRCVTIRQQGGYLPSNCKIKDGWQVYRGETLIPMPTEQAFLDFLGLGWIDLQDRK